MKEFQKEVKFFIRRSYVHLVYAIYVISLDFCKTRLPLESMSVSIIVRTFIE